MLFIFSYLATAEGLTSFCIELTSDSFLIRIVGSFLIDCWITGSLSITGFELGPFDSLIEPLLGPDYGPGAAGFAEITSVFCFDDPPPIFKFLEIFNK